VQLLLRNESAQISADTKALNTRDNDILKLNAATSAKQIKQLEKTLTRLNHQIVAMTLELQALSGQAFTTASSLTPPNPALVSTSLGNLLTVQSLSTRAGLGVGPATPSQ
jgi:predicted  nucleic acid-binding Zn-ribbon protein